MKRELKSALLAGSVIAASLGSGTVLAEVTANVAATSNYIWRGITQSADLSAVSGGVDYTQASGFYAGGWTSSLASSQYELDLYAGYRGTHKAVDFDVGLIQYRYPVGDDKLDFMELQGKVMYQIYTFTLATMLTHENSAADEDAIYMAVNAEKEVNGMMLGAVIGRASGDDLKNNPDIGDEYIHYGVSASKDNITLALEKNNLGSDLVNNPGNNLGDLRVTVTWSMEIDLIK